MIDFSKYDAVVVGCGLTGGVIARHLAENHGKNVLMIERRNHIAGNMYDYTNENGILLQKYGPHVFHTVKKSLFDFMNGICDWYDFRVSCMAEIMGKLTPSPFNFSTIDTYYPVEHAEELKRRLKNAYNDADKATIVELMENSDPMICQYAQFLFQEDYGPYTAKQWGIQPSEVDVSVLKRVPILFSYKTDYFDDEYQKMPKGGFSAFYEKLISHPNINVRLNTDALELISIENDNLMLAGTFASIPVIYTGAVDELFGLKFGSLPYRSLRFDVKLEATDSYQEAPIVAYPKAEGYTRITEYTKMPPQAVCGKTVIAVEYPQRYIPGVTEPYYPILTENSKAMYEKYKAELKKVSNLFVCGRLGDFKYYNMDQALERALEMCNYLDKKLGVD